MFSFLKKKLKGALSTFNKKVEDGVKDEEQEIIKEVTSVKEKKKPVKPQKKPVKQVTQEKKEQPETTKPVSVEEVVEVEKKGLFGKIKEKIVTKRISVSKFEELFSDLELVLLENNVALEVIDKIKTDLQEKLVDHPIPRGEVSGIVLAQLRKSITELFPEKTIDVVTSIKQKKEKPYVICFFGINGSGKTTTIAKFANLLKQQGLSVLLVAGDTWRAASIQQLEEHARRLGVRIIKHNYGSDPAAVAFDGVKAGKINNVDVVLVDTAGRQHSNKDLMREMEKIVRVTQPDMKIFVGESITGNDCVLQAQQFNDVVAFDAVILTKSDVDEKGGAAISLSYVTGKPILYLGTGQEYTDLEKFDSNAIIQSLDLQ